MKNVNFVVVNIPILANAEKLVAIPQNCRSFDIQTRSGQQVLYSHIQQGTTNGPYFTLRANGVLSESDFDMIKGMNFYFLCTAADVIEIFLGLEG